MELRAAAHISGDVAMTEAFTAGLDLHRLTAAGFTGGPPEEVSDAERNAAKAVNFGAVYGMGAEGLVQTAWNNYGMRLEISEAKQRLDAFSAAYPQLAEWRGRHANICRARGYVRALVQRRARMRGGFIGSPGTPPLSRARRTAGSSRTRRAATCLSRVPAPTPRCWRWRFDKALPEFGIAGGPLIWCHDEIVLEVREEDSELAAALLKQTMTRTFSRARHEPDSSRCTWPFVERHEITVSDLSFPPGTIEFRTLGCNASNLPSSKGS